MLDLSAIYDDLMENLRVRYVLTYKSSADPTSERPRTVRIALWRIAIPRAPILSLA